MTGPSAPLPGAFALDGGPIGCLLLHDLGGSPEQMSGAGEFLHTLGLTVSAPLLGGYGAGVHGASPLPWQEWVSLAEAAFLVLRSRCAAALILGLGMGALTAIHLAIMYPTIAGIALCSPSLRLASRSWWRLDLSGRRHSLRNARPGAEGAPGEAGRGEGYDSPAAVSELARFGDIVRAELRDVHVPAIVFYSRSDPLLHPAVGRLTYEGLGTTDKELVTLHRSGHDLLADSEHEHVLARVYGFIMAHTREAP